MKAIDIHGMTNMELVRGEHGKCWKTISIGKILFSF